jgi:predicted transcriptional regulator
MRISTAESEIMRTLWAKSPLTAEEIATALADDQNWAEGTIKALINRLLKKNAIAAEKEGRRFLYRPLVAQGDYVHAESRGLLDRLFHGRLAPLVSHFSQRERLSAEDVAELRAILKAHDDGQ